MTAAGTGLCANPGGALPISPAVPNRVESAEHRVGDVPTDWWLAPGQLFDGEAMVSDRAIRISGDRIVKITPKAMAGHDGAPVRTTSRIAAPGFFDVKSMAVAVYCSTPTRRLQALRSSEQRIAGRRASFLPTFITDSMNGWSRQRRQQSPPSEAMALLASSRGPYQP